MKKKDNERFFVEWFAKKIGWEACKIFDDEAPDFGIKFPQKVIGLEITNLYKDEKRKGSKVKRNEKHRLAWLSAASKKYYEISKIPLMVKIRIIMGQLDSNPETLAYELSQNNNIEIKEKLEFGLILKNKCKLKIYIQRLPDNFECYNRWIFIDNHIGYSKPISETLIQKKN